MPGLRDLDWAYRQTGLYTACSENATGTRLLEETMETRASSRRDQLLETAAELFYRNGCHTTGIDRLLAEAGVAKMTLYKHFKSKENLVLAVATRLNDQLREEFEQVAEQRKLSPRGQLLALVDLLQEWCQRPDFCGCPMVNLAVQYPDPKHPIHQAAAENKRFRIDYISDLARRAGAKDPQRLATEIVLLLEGAVVMVQTTGDGALVERAREGIGKLVELELGPEDEASAVGQ